MLEWQFNRDVARRLCVALSAAGIANHELVPHVDVDLGPSDRAHLANYLAHEVSATADDVYDQGALPAILVSIHANAHGNGRDFNDANGITVLHYPTSTRSKAIAQVFQDALIGATGLRDRGIKGRDDLSILRKTNMPAVLTENGFYTNEAECYQLLDDDFRERIVQAHVAACMALDAE